MGLKSGHLQGDSKDKPCFASLTCQRLLPALPPASKTAHGISAGGPHVAIVGGRRIYQRRRIRRGKEFIRLHCHRQQRATQTRGARVSPEGRALESFIRLDRKVPNRLVHKSLIGCR